MLKSLYAAAAITAVIAAVVVDWRAAGFMWLAWFCDNMAKALREREIAAAKAERANG